MPTIAFCPKGGQSGILISEQERAEFGKQITQLYSNLFIPLPDTSLADQKKKMQNCSSNHAAMQDAQYWEEIKTGRHGWCCSECGKILQLG
jgi:hypothetical protein